MYMLCIRRHSKQQPLYIILKCFLLELYSQASSHHKKIIECEMIDSFVFVSFFCVFLFFFVGLLFNKFRPCQR
jgi:hypothetical protein